MTFFKIQITVLLLERSIKVFNIRNVNLYLTENLLAFLDIINYKIYCRKWRCIKIPIKVTMNIKMQYIPYIVEESSYFIYN